MTSLAAVVVPAAAKHTATYKSPKQPSPSWLVFLHGLGDTGYGWSSISENFRLRGKFDEVAFIFPHAPPIPITCNGGMRMPGWYDIKDFGNLNSVDDEVGMLKSVSHTNKIITEQIDQGIPPERIFVGGFSQGSVIALLTGLTSERPLGGIVALSSYLPLRNKIANMVTDRGKEIPIFMAHGKQDAVVRYSWGEQSKDLLGNMGQEVVWKAYDDLEHSASPAEINDLEKWLEGRLKATTA